MITNNFNSANRSSTRRASFKSMNLPEIIENGIKTEIKKCNGRKILGKTFGKNEAKKGLLEEFLTCIRTFIKENVGGDKHNFTVTGIRADKKGKEVLVNLQHHFKFDSDIGPVSQHTNYTGHMPKGSIHNDIDDFIKADIKEQEGLEAKWKK